MLASTHHLPPTCRPSFQNDANGPMLVSGNHKSNNDPLLNFTVGIKRSGEQCRVKQNNSCIQLLYLINLKAVLQLQHCYADTGLKKNNERKETENYETVLIRCYSHLLPWWQHRQQEHIACLLIFVLWISGAGVQALVRQLLFSYFSLVEIETAIAVVVVFKKKLKKNYLFRWMDCDIGYEKLLFLQPYSSSIGKMPHWILN